MYLFFKFSIVQKLLISLLISQEWEFSLLSICGALIDLVPFVQFKKREKHPWRGIAFSKVVGFSLQRY